MIDFGAYFGEEPDMVELLRARLAEGEAPDAHRAELGSRVQDMHGPLGELLRTIAASYMDFLDAYEVRGTTEGEAIRVEQITDAAVACELWLREGS